MLDWWIYAALTATALLAGFIDAIAGGGGLIMMPALLFTGMPPHMALGTNKLQSTLGTAMATRTFWRGGLLDIAGNRWTIATVFAGSCAGALIVQQIDAGALELVVPVLLLASAAYIVLSPRMSDHAHAPRVAPAGYRPVAGAIGFYDGFFGPGTGSLLVTSLVALRGRGLLLATAEAKLLNATSNVAALLLFALGGKIHWLLGLCMACGSMTGGLLGSRSAMRFGSRLIRPLLIFISLSLTARLLWGWFQP